MLLVFNTVLSMYEINDIYIADSMDRQFGGKMTAYTG